jgi:pyruvate/2-oxoglutarate dehydrogenase complex dihydrolipoamide dehydrogenase (E3) component
VDVFFGEARFVGPDTVAVGEATLRFTRAVIASGARAAVPEVPGLREAGFRTNENIFALKQLPSRLAVVGGGPIGCELAQAFARLGSRVSIIHNTPRLLPRDDPDAAALVADALRRDGVSLQLGSRLERVSRAGDARVLHLAGGLEVAADEVLVAAGRKPNVEGLGLEAAGVAFDDHAGVRVDDRLRTTNPRIYAAGDICSHWKFTHAADALARIAIRNALFRGRARASALTVPWCTYTDPELAQVGLRAEDARERGLAVEVFTQPFDRVDRAILDGEPGGFVKVVARKGSDRILGATVVGAHAGELIAELTLAMTHGIGLGKLAATIHAYPTHAEAVRKAGDAWNRTRLTPLVRWLFGKWLAWNR